MDFRFLFSAVPVIMTLTIGLFLWQWWCMPSPRGTVFTLAGILATLAFFTEVNGLVTTWTVAYNGAVYNLYILAEAMLVLAMASTVLVRARGVFLIAALGLIGVFAYSFQLSDMAREVNMVAVLVNSLVLSGVILAVLWHLSQRTEVPLVREPEFWLFMGFLVYFGGIIPVIGVEQLLSERNWWLGTRLYKIVPGLAMVRYLFGVWGCRLARVNGK